MAVQMEFQAAFLMISHVWIPSVAGEHAAQSLTPPCITAQHLLIFTISIEEDYDPFLVK